ncbi:Plasmid stabilization system protein ParE [Algoriphagus locisalis]|uniref:Plasmid stabilization system protein ParE n=1 Tax=Algoriphagus locisalis TaxID=305507 RepID=A0A1I7BKK7_9BACT|nr:type II toxin-antitoxin system RelE/ParE family toxin [Algoriphagus locisalis]SFT87695.1 Plasmid stabilization system protein ParE [Algoriphagus locisalis]
MDLEVYWTDFAEQELFKIFNYYKKEAGYTIAKKLIDGIYEEPFILKTQPEIGQIEELLKDREREFRYLIYKNNFKIIYWLNNARNHIEIIDVFDVRQNPPKIRRTQEDK